MTSPMERLAAKLKPDRPAPRFVNGRVVSKANGVAKVDVGGQVVDVPNAAGVGAGSVVRLVIDENTPSVQGVLAGGSPNVPVGAVTMWITTTPPPGWLILDGASFDGAKYPELAGVLGGTTLPNFTDRAPVGAGNKALRSTGGAANVSLGVNELPVHSHDTGYAIGSIKEGTGAAVSVGYPTTGGSSTGPEGNGAAFSVQNPYVAVRFIIFAGGAAS